MSTLTVKQFEHWLLQIRRSDERAFSELFRWTYNPMLRYATRLVNSEAAAHDILQEVYIKLWHKRYELDENKSLKAYMYRMVRNKCFNYLRDTAREEIGFDENITPDDSESTTDSELSTEQLALLNKKLDCWIEELPARQREAFELSRFEGLDHHEIANIMACSPRTVNNHIVNALNYLRNRHLQSLND